MKKDDITLSLYDFLDEKDSTPPADKNDGSLLFSFFCWNINNPSLKRARNQAAWLRKQSADVFVLTECKHSEGCNFLEKYFQTFGYYVVFSKPEKNEYGVMIISKHKLTKSIFSNHIDYLQSRVISVKVPFFNDELEVIGIYVPSRDSSYEKKERKKRFIKKMISVLEKENNPIRRVFCGDFNVLEPKHIPHYPIYENWEYDFYSNLTKYQLKDAFRHLSPEIQEYSWVGRKGDGYRYDHFFVTSDLIPLVQKCYYYHEPREMKLSDHSALISTLRCGIK